MIMEILGSDNPWFIGLVGGNYWVEYYENAAIPFNKTESNPIKNSSA